MGSGHSTSSESLADLPWGMLVNGEVRHPSQLYEAALEGTQIVPLDDLQPLLGRHPGALGLESADKWVAKHEHTRLTSGVLDARQPILGLSRDGRGFLFLVGGSGVLGRFFGVFNRGFESITGRYARVAGGLVRKSVLALGLVAIFTAGAGVPIEFRLSETPCFFPSELIWIE